MNKIYLLKHILIGGMTLFACSCSTDSLDEIEEPKDYVLKEITVSSRTEASAFQNGDKLGMYVVENSIDPNKPLQSSGNLVDNSKWIFDGFKWTSEKDLHFQEGMTLAKCVAYYPYTLVKDALNVEFEVPENQLAAQRIMDYDILFASNWINRPTARPTFEMRHVLSKLLIDVVPGAGFTQEEIDKADIEVKMHRVCRKFLFNLEDGSIENIPGVSTITAHKENNSSFNLLVPPQDISQGKLIEVIIDGHSYFYTSTQVYFSTNKEYWLKIPLKRKNGDFDIDLDAWEDAGDDFGGSLG